MKNLLLEAVNLSKYYPIYTGFLKKHTADVKAVEAVSLKIPYGKTVGLVGESGCGKSTLSRLFLMLEAATSGELRFENQPTHALSQYDLAGFRRKVQVVFQDPFASLNPRMTIEEILADPVQVHEGGKYAVENLRQVLEEVGLSANILGHYPHEFSGGQRQRIGIARALVLNPSLIICDEAVSALDVSVQAQILNLLVTLQKKRDLSLLFISHNLGVVHYMSDLIAVMYLGQIVESGPADQIFHAPRHPYTKALLAADPKIGQSSAVKQILSGELPSPLNPPSGCYFHPRCPQRQSNCDSGEFPLIPLEPNGESFTRCPYKVSE